MEKKQFIVRVKKTSNNYFGTIVGGPVEGKYLKELLRKTKELVDTRYLKFIPERVFNKIISSEKIYVIDIEDQA